MMHAHAYMPIIAAAAAEMIVGMVWYSNHLFGPAWKKAGGKLASPKDLYTKLAMHGVAALLMATALFIAISIFQKTQTAVYAQDGFGRIFGFFLHDGSKQNNELLSALKTAGFLWLGFFVPSKAMCTIWGSQNWQKFMIGVSGKLAGLLAMAAMIASLS